MATKIICKNVRISYAHLFEPKKAKGSDTAKYSASLIIPKKNTKLINAIEEAIEAEAIEKFGSKAPALLRKAKGGLNNPLRDGDDEREDDPAYKNAMFVNASSKRQPQCVARDLSPIMDEAELYSGCYANVSVAFFPFEVDGNRGIGAGLNNVQKVKDGERLGGAANADEDFEALDDEDEDEDFDLD
jgi:hypothetical protein